MVSLVELKKKCSFHPNICMLEDSDKEIKGVWCPKCQQLGVFCGIGETSAKIGVKK